MHTPMTCSLADDAQTFGDLENAIRAKDDQKIGQILKEDPSLATVTSYVSSHPNRPATSLHHRITTLI